MNGMFNACNSLTELDVSGFDTKNVTNMRVMFYACCSLTELDVSGFDTKNVIYMKHMFGNCLSLKTIYASENWNNGNIRDSEDMFYRCSNLVGGKGTTYNSGKTDIEYAHIDGGAANPGYFTYKEIEEDVPEDTEDIIPSDGGNGQTSGAYTVLQNGTLTFYHDNNRNSKTGTVYDIYTSYTGYPDWAKDSLSITKVVFDVSFINFKPTCTAYWFSCCPIMTEIEGLGRLDTRNVTDMRYMFHNCRSLKKLDTGDFLTSQVTDMSNMFSGCHKLSSVDVTCFNTSNITTMEAMFMDCRSLTEIDVTGFETKNVSTMAHMFRGCDSLTEVNLKNMSIASLRSTYAMFYDCDALTTIYSNTDWSAGNITSSDFMFGHCTQLKGGNGTLFDARNTNKSYALPDGGNSRPGYFTMRNGGGTPGGIVGTNGAPVYAVLNNGILTFYCDNLWSSRAGTRYDIDDLNYSYSDQLRSYRTMPEWIEDRNYIKRAVFDPSFANYKPKSTVCWFYSCQNLTAIEGMEYLNTSEVTNMSAMFRFCYALTDVDVSHMDTRNVTDMSFVFCYCESLKHIDVSMFITEKVTNMEHMFHTCPVDTLDLRNFETSKVTNMNTMFDWCRSLKTIYAKRDKWNTDNVTNSSWMFTGCKSLVGGQGTKFDSNHTDKEYAVIDEGMCAPGYLTGDAADLPREAYAVYKDSTLTFYYDCNINCRDGEIYTTNEFVAHNDIVGWSGVKSGIKTVEFDTSFKDYDQLIATRAWFQNCGSLEQFVGIENLVTTNVTDMSSMFFECRKLTSLDLSGFKTDNVTDMNGMFYNCIKLTSLNVSGFKTDNVTNMRHMFRNCRSLTSFDLSGFKTDNVTDMSWMFSLCKSLESLDLSGFNTDKVTNMSWMFDDCKSLKSLVVSGFKTDNVTNMGCMFGSCSGLTSLDVSGFKTDNVTDIGGMFVGCHGLTSLDVSGFKTDNVTYMSSMFAGCSSLTSLDVSNFNTSNVTDMDGMFYGCINLRAIDLSTCVQLPQITVSRSSGIFEGVAQSTCIYLPGGEGHSDGGEKNVIIGRVCTGGIEFYDNLSFENPVEFETDVVSYDRTFTSGVTATVCLPYTIAATNVSGGKFYSFGGVGNDYTVTMNEVTGDIQANTPYLFVPSASALTCDGNVTVSIVNDETNTSVADGEWMFCGTYNEIRWVTDEDFGGSVIYGFAANDYGDNVSAGDFVRVEASENSRISPFRAYLKFTPVAFARQRMNCAAALPNRMKVVLADSQPTSVKNIDAADNSTEVWRSIDGKRLTSEPVKHGIYIRSGKKVVK